MSETSQLDTVEERLALARAAFRDYYIRCFWFMDPELVVTEETLERIAEGLRQNGDRKAFLLAQRICP